MTTKQLDDYDRVVGRTENPDDGISFDVTVERVIGTIRSDPFGAHAPHVAAMMLIAEHAEDDGVYRFPSLDGRLCTVTVTFTS